MIGGANWANIALNLGTGAWVFVGLIVLGVGLTAIPIFGKTAGRVVTVGAFAGLFFQMRTFFLFDYPDLFPGSWTYLAWIIRIIFLCIFVIPLAIQVLTSTQVQR